MLLIRLRLRWNQDFKIIYFKLRTYWDDTHLLTSQTKIKTRIKQMLRLCLRLREDFFKYYLMTKFSAIALYTRSSIFSKIHRSETRSAIHFNEKRLTPRNLNPWPRPHGTSFQSKRPVLHAKVAFFNCSKSGERWSLPPKRRSGHGIYAAASVNKIILTFVFESNTTTSVLSK